MSIAFFDLLGDANWEPYTFDLEDPNHFWVWHQFMRDAPVDVAATLDGGISYSSDVRSDFNMRGVRLRPDFVVPRRHHNLRQLVFVVGGSVEIEHGTDTTETISLVAGDLWNADAETRYITTAGPGGVTYLECWPEPMPVLETFWHEGGWIKP